jgi:hypothetical protein
VPLGDFFGVTHGRIREFGSYLVAMAKLGNPAENLATIARFAEPYHRGEFDLALERLRALGLP